MISVDVQLDGPTVKWLIKKHYGMEVFNLEKVRAAYCVETNAGVFAFKNARKMKDIHFINQVIHHLKKTGFPRIPSLFPTQNGKLLVSYRAEKYYMEKWLTGVKEVSRKRSDWLAPAGVALATYHQSLSRFPFSACPPKRNALGIWPKWLQEKQRILKGLSAHAGFSGEMRDIIDFARRRVELAVHFWYRSQPEKRLDSKYAITLCHGSLHHENIMIDEKNRIWFIDYERLVLDERVRDLAQLMQYHLSRHQWREEEISNFLDAYSSTSSLGSREYLALCSRLAAPSRVVRKVISLSEEPSDSLKLSQLWKMLTREMRKESFLQKMLGKGME